MPGTKGPNTRPKLFIKALNRAIAQDSADRLRKAAEKLLDLAAEGESWALAMLADRLDGKPVQDTNIVADIAVARAAELSDDDLASIATGHELDAQSVH